MTQAGTLTPPAGSLALALMGCSLSLLSWLAFLPLPSPWDLAASPSPLESEVTLPAKVTGYQPGLGTRHVHIPALSSEGAWQALPPSLRTSLVRAVPTL